MARFIRELLKWIRELIRVEPEPVPVPVPEPLPSIQNEYLCGLGDPENILYRGDRDAIINRMIAHGGNALYFHVSCAHGGDTPSGNPFKNGDPNQGLDPGIAARLKGMVDKMDTANIWSYLFLYDDSSQPFGNYDTVTAAEDQYIRQLVALGGHTH